MAEGIVQVLVVQLGSVLSKEYKLMKGLESEVRYIRDELESMCAFLRYAEAKRDADLLDNEQKVWFKQILEVAYDSEDIVDEFLLRFSNTNDAGIFGHVRQMYTSVKNLPSRRRISSKISDIKNRVKQISDRHQIYRSNEGITETSSNKSYENPIRGHALLFSEADLVGIDPPRRDIISLILSDESHRKAISVWGMGGIGKTTLVKRVYEAPDVKSVFTNHAWLTISQTFAIRDALKNLIHQLFKEVKQPIPTEVDSMDADGLRTFVKNFLTGKKYIIVLDDLWEWGHWDSIKYVFPNDVFGSRIIITTRKNDIAQMCCHEFDGNVYMLEPLSSVDSWQLFCKTTFRDGGCPPHLVDISRNILNKCGGLPLGIVVIGGLLASKDSKLGEWEIVLRSLGGELEGNGQLDSVRRILLLSYNDLPYYLKSCLLYMGMFPEDAIVDTRDLIYFWKAEGFVEMKTGMTTIEVAQSYLDGLVGRSLVHVVDTDTAGNILSCHVHDQIYEIIHSKCKEYNISPAGFTPNSAQLRSIRRFVVDESNFPKEPAHMLHLRSIITNYKSYSCISDSSLPKLLKASSKLLKVLHLESPNLTIIPDLVFTFSNLTYLNLSGTKVTNISRRIRHLHNLTYLNLSGTNVKNISRRIRHLHNLTYLNLSSTDVTKIPKSIRHLHNLTYLNLLGTSVTKIPKSIRHLHNLEYLFLDYTNVTELPDDIVTLKKLYHLSVGGTSGIKAPCGFGALVSLHHLRYIDAHSENVIHEIGKLTQLRSLEITKVTRENGRTVCSTLEKLTNLQKLSIHTAENEIMDVDYPLVSNLQFLYELAFVGSLVKIPNWVPYCHSLTTLALYDSCLSKNPLGCLEGMRNLVDLRLVEAYTGDTLNFKAGGFLKLKKLELKGLRGLKSMRFEKGTLPELETLEIGECKCIEELPEDIQHLTKLQTLYLYLMPKSLTDGLRNLKKESEGYQNISHITEIKHGYIGDEDWVIEYLKW